MAERSEKTVNGRMALLAVVTSVWTVLGAEGAIINVTNGSATTLRNAVNNARAGDTVVVSGTYNLGTSGLTSNANGTASNRITIRAGAAGATINGSTSGSGNGIAINHDYWSVEGIRFNGFQKSVRIDSASHGILKGLTFSGSTGEAVKLRNTSTYWLVENCAVLSAGAEGYYVGDADQNWEGGVADESGYVTFLNCTSANTGNDGFDFKEGSNHIRVINCAADWNFGVPGVLDRGNSGIYSRADVLQVSGFRSTRNNSTGDAIRIFEFLAEDGNYYGSENEFLGVTASEMLGSFLYTRMPGTRLQADFRFEEMGEGFREPGSLVAEILPVGAFTELTWAGIGGGSYGLAGVAGDADFSGVVNSFDYSVVDDNFGQVGMGYMNGDLNADGVVDSFDYAVIDDNFGAGLLGAYGGAGNGGGVGSGEVIGGAAGGVTGGAAGGVFVPEPGMMGTAGGFAMVMLGRRKRR